MQTELLHVFEEKEEHAAGSTCDDALTGLACTVASSWVVISHPVEEISGNGGRYLSTAALVTH